MSQRNQKKITPRSNTNRNKMYGLFTIQSLKSFAILVKSHTIFEAGCMPGPLSAEGVCFLNNSEWDSLVKYSSEACCSTTQTHRGLKITINSRVSLSTYKWVSVHPSITDGPPTCPRSQ